MVDEKIRGALAADPFVPFTFRLAGGDLLRVGTRDRVARSPSGRTIVVFHPDESWNVFDLGLVRDVIVEPTPPKPS